MRIQILTGVLALVAGVAFIATSAASATTGATPHMAVKPASQNVELGSGDFTVDIEVQNASGVGAFEFVLKYDPSILEYKGVIEGAFADQFGAQKFCAKAIGDDYVMFGCGRTGDFQNQTGIGGSGIAGTVTFAPKKAGTSQLLFSKAQLSDPEGVADAPGAPPTVSDGVVQVYEPGDEPDELAPTPRPDASRLTPTAVVGAPTEESLLLTPVPGSSGNTGNSRGNSNSNSRGSGRSGTVAGRGVSGAGRVASDQNFPVAGYGQQQDADASGLYVGIGLVAAGVVLLASGGRMMSRRRER